LLDLCWFIFWGLSAIVIGWFWWVLCFAGNTGTDLSTLVPMVPVTQVMAKPYWNIYWYVAPYEWCSLNSWFVLLANWCYFPFLCGLAAEIVCAI
jgi:hypothetical protein